MLTTLARRGASRPTTHAVRLRVLRIALGRAVKSGRVVRNVATLVDPPAKARREMQPLSARPGADVRRRRSAADRFGQLYGVAIATGMRQGELLALRWSDVDLDDGTVTVRHTLAATTGELAEPKTDRARRTLRSAVAVAMLREQRRRQLEERLAAGRSWQDGDFVFTTPDRDAARLPERHPGLQAALAAAGLPHQRFHDLRHAYATLMLEDGEELAVVSRTLGHADLSTTADVYAHLTPGCRSGPRPHGRDPRAPRGRVG